MRHDSSFVQFGPQPVSVKGLVAQKHGEFDEDGSPIVHPTMAHFFYMDEADPTKVKRWYGAIGPISFG